MEFTHLRNVFFVPKLSKLNHKWGNRFFDKDKKIIRYSTFDDCFDETYISACNDFESQFIQTSVNKEGLSVIAVTYWPACYGHIIESMFHLYDAYLNRSFLHHKVMLGIPSGNNNLIQLAKYLFGDRFINSFEFDGDEIVKIDSVVLIHNYMNTSNWFKWNNDQMLLEIKKFYDNSYIFSPKGVFLTRSVHSNHDKNSVLANLDEINKFFIDIGFFVIDPQFASDRDLYNYTKNCEILVTTNGSALTPLVFFKELRCKIYCLNSSRYLPDWRRLLKNDTELKNYLEKNSAHKLNDFEKELWEVVTKRFEFEYIDSFENIVETNRLLPIADRWKNIINI